MQRSSNTLSKARVGSLVVCTAAVADVGDAMAEDALRLLGSMVVTAPLVGIAALGLWAGADPWYWLGPLYKVDGPDTAGEKGAAVAAWMTGQLSWAIAQDEAEPEQAVGPLCTLTCAAPTTALPASWTRPGFVPAGRVNP